MFLDCSGADIERNGNLLVRQPLSQPRQYVLFSLRESIAHIEVISLGLALPTYRATALACQYATWRKVFHLESCSACSVRTKSRQYRREAFFIFLSKQPKGRARDGFVEATGSTARTRSSPGQLRLSRRETEILGWVAQGKTNPEIGTILGISHRTVQKHLERIYGRLGVENRHAAMSVAMQTARRSIGAHRRPATD